jgi:hypothetical protein
MGDGYPFLEEFSGPGCYGSTDRGDASVAFFGWGGVGCLATLK